MRESVQALLVVLSAAVAVVAIVVLVSVVVEATSDPYYSTDAQIARCQAKGGVLLDRTYSAGKSTSHMYTCVRKDTILEVN